MKRVRFTALVLLLFFVFPLTAAKSKRGLAVTVVLDGEILLEQTFSESDELPFSYKVFGFNYASYLNKLREKGLDDRERLDKTFQGLTTALDALCDAYYVPARNAEVSFYPNRADKFEIVGEAEGREINREKLFFDIANGVRKKSARAVVSVVPLYPELTERQLKQNTIKRSTFATSYKSSAAGRKSNIERAVSFINGTRVSPGEIFSFNKTVGQRTRARGFEEAPIIVDGKYISGVGGGVCQVSTTLYNAVLRANLPVVSVNRHSLPVSYVKPSFDAMVSSVSDFKFTNDTPYDIFIEARAEDGRLSFILYGAALNAEVAVESETVRIIPRKITYVDDENASVGESTVISEGADGLESRGYLIVNQSGQSKKILIRHDVYLPRPKIIARGTAPIPDTENDEVNHDNILTLTA